MFAIMMLNCRRATDAGDWVAGEGGGGGAGGAGWCDGGGVVARNGVRAPEDSRGGVRGLGNHTPQSPARRSANFMRRDTKRVVCLAAQRNATRMRTASPVRHK